MGQLLALCGAIPHGAIRERKGEPLWATSGGYNRLRTAPCSATQPETSQVAGHSAALFLPASTTSRQDLHGSGGMRARCAPLVLFCIASGSLTRRRATCV